MMHFHIYNHIYIYIYILRSRHNSFQEKYSFHKQFPKVYLTQNNMIIFQNPIKKLLTSQPQNPNSPSSKGDQLEPKQYQANLSQRVKSLKLYLTTNQELPSKNLIRQAYYSTSHVMYSTSKISQNTQFARHRLPFILINHSRCHI